MLRRTPLRLLALLASGCGSPSKEPMADGSPPVSEAEDTPTSPEIVDPPEGDYLADDASDDLPVLDAAALSVAINEALTQAMALHGGPVTAAYTEAVSGMDSDCPTWGVDNGTPFWFDTCTSDSGTLFDGYGYQAVYTDELVDDTTFSGLALYTVARIVSPDGSVFEGAGGASFLQGVNASGQDVWSSYVHAGFAYDGRAAEGTWLADGLDPDMSWYAVRDPASGGAASVLTGSSAVTDSAIEAVVFDQLLLFNEVFGSSCPMEPNGSISVLDSEGHWFDLYFHGQYWGDPATPEDLCDGCGEAWYAGTYLGEVCLDFSPLRDWSAYPFAE